MTEKTAKPPPADVANTTYKTPTETIGSRLRKRRRTDPSPSGDSPPAPKRLQSRKKPSAADSEHPDRMSKSSVTQGTHGTGSYEPAQRFDQLPAVEGEETVLSQQQPFARISPEYQGAPDFNAVIADIINHGETVDNHYAVRNFEDEPMAEDGMFQTLSASFTLKSQSLPVLDNLVSFHESSWYSD